MASNQLLTTIPVVEWSVTAGGPADDEKWRLSRAIHAACEQSGFFFLRNHGIPPSLLEAVYAEARRFYSQPLDDKRRFSCSADTEYLGYREVGAERSLTHSGREACEQYRIGYVADPPAGGWAGLYHRPFGAATRLLERLATIGNEILSLSALALNLPATVFDLLMEKPVHRLGLNHYPVGAGSALGNRVHYSMTSHVDHAFFTILTQNAPGLEVLGSDGRWIDVPVRPHEPLVFLGDYLERWTNGGYRATYHRVRDVSTDRISLQFKHRPSYGAIIEPSQFVDDEHPSRYEPFDTGRQYAELLRSLLGV
ncbi:Iron/ascorbate oxidoreductase [Frankia sp. AiPs1]